MLYFLALLGLAAGTAFVATTAADTIVGTDGDDEITADRKSVV